jgi:hypothetical protein
MRALTLCARADLEVDRVALRPIDEMMTISDPSLETRGVARLQHGRSTIVDQRDLALEGVNELVFSLVPLRRVRLTPNCVSPTTSPSAAFSRPSVTARHGSG